MSYLRLMQKRHVIRLHNAVFYAYHGNHHEERNLGGKFYVDVEMETDFTDAAEHDSLSETVNYDVVYDTIQSVVIERNYYLIESVAKRIAALILSRFPQVSCVRVRVRKPGAPIKGVVDYVEVEVDECR